MSDIKQLLSRAINKLRDDSLEQGTLGVHRPDSTVDMQVTGRAGWLHVTLNGQTPVKAYNKAGVPQTTDLQVDMRVIDGRRVIVGVSSFDNLSVPVPVPPSGVLAHASTHQTGGGDALTLDASAINLSRLGSTVQHDLQFMQNTIHSSGWVSGGEITDNGDGTIDVASGIGLIRATDSSLDTLYFCDWAASAGISLTDQDTTWIYITYNAGTPIVTTSTVEPTDYNTNIILAEIYRNGTDVHSNTSIRHTVGDHALLMMRSMLEIMPFANVTGGHISAVGTRQFAITAGAWWTGLTRFETPAFDGTVDTFGLYYRDGVGGWTESAGQTSITSTIYDNNSGTPATLTPNRYGVHWVFLAVDGDINVLLGQGNYLLADAQDAMVPSSIPIELTTDSRLIGKIIIQSGASAFTSIESALMTTFSAAIVTEHNTLSGLQGGTASEYYHLTAAELSKLTGIEALADVTDAANVGSSIHGATAKTTPVDADTMPLIDSAASNVLKKVTWANIKATIATYYNSLAATLTNKTLDSTNISTLTAKNPPVDADSAVIVDSAASNVFKRVTYTNIKAFLKTYFDTIYGRLASANTWTANNAFNSTATTGSALSATRDLAAASTDSPVASIVQDNASDDQAALYVQQDGSGAVIVGYDGATKVFELSDGGTLNVYTVIKALSASGISVQDDGGNEAMLIEDGGFVNVTSTNAAGSAVIRYTNDGGDSGGTSQIGVGGSANANAALADRLILYGRNASGVSVIATATAGGDIRFYSTLAAERACITSAGDFGIGTTAPQGLLHAVQGSGSFMFEVKAGIVGTKVVIIANGTGDVTQVLTGFFTLSDGTSGVANAISMIPTDTYAIAVGGSTWTLTLAANGEFSVQRTAGSGTATMTFMLTWI